jgi:hypothetical protein
MSDTQPHHVRTALINVVLIGFAIGVAWLVRGSWQAGLLLIVSPIAIFIAYVYGRRYAFRLLYVRPFERAVAERQGERMVPRLQRAFRRLDRYDPNEAQFICHHLAWAYFHADDHTAALTVLRRFIGETDSLHMELVFLWFWVAIAHRHEAEAREASGVAASDEPEALSRWYAHVLEQVIAARFGRYKDAIVATRAAEGAPARYVHLSALFTAFSVEQLRRQGERVSVSVAMEDEIRAQVVYIPPPVLRSWPELAVFCESVGAAPKETLQIDCLPAP